MTIGDLLAALTLEEKAALTAGANEWSTVAVPRLGIPSLQMSDGPNGARGPSLSTLSRSLPSTPKTTLPGRLFSSIGYTRWAVRRSDSRSGILGYRSCAARASTRITSPR